MTTYLLSQISNFKRCNVCYQPALEVEAVVDAVIQTWGDLGMVEGTAENGVDGEDGDMIEQFITEEGLDCTREECEDALLKECEERVGGAI